MDSTHFLRGIIVGFLAAVPIGPVNVMCIQRTLSMGRAVGLVSGLGAATVDAFYGGVAGLGLTMISEMLERYAGLLRLSGGFFILFMGIKTIMARPVLLLGEDHAAGLPRAYFSTLLLTLANPTTVFFYGLLFAGLETMRPLHRVENAVLLVPGVFLGSALWWFILTGTIGMLKSRMNDKNLKRLNWTAGCIVAGFGLFILLRPR
jgi:threonine/homoserine/homoserine lactone efflux protein